MLADGWSDLATWAPWLLTAVRLWAVLRVQALWRATVRPMWPFASFGLALVLTPVVGSADASPSGPFDLLLALGLEFALGTALGLVASLPGYALLGASVGTAGLLRVAGEPWVYLVMALVAAAVLQLGLHHPVLTVLVEHAARFPIGEPSQWSDAIAGPHGIASSLPRLLHGFVVLALGFATPALLCTAVVETTLAAIGAGPPSASMLTDPLRAWLRVALALVALGASWAAYLEVWAEAAIGLRPA